LEIAALASEARAYFASLLGNSPETPLKIAAVKRGGGFSSGGTILFDEAVLRREKIDSAAVMSIAEGVAKLWAGDGLRTGGDGNGVIREGLVRFLATNFIENKYGKGVADVERTRQRVAYSFVSARDAALTQAVPLDDFYYSAVANKGAMFWRLLSVRVGTDEFYKRVRSEFQDRAATLAELRSAFSDQKELIDAMLDKATDTNLMVGLPQQRLGETAAALRNTGSIDVTVGISANLANGERMIAPATIRATSFGEITFKTPQKVVRLEIDSEKLYPQTDYSDDVAPREATESDLQLAVKRAFDKQDYAGAEAAAKIVLREYPNYDDIRILYARALLGLNRNAEAEREFRAALNEKLPTARTLAWGNLGLAEVANRNGQGIQALRFAEAAIRADAEYGASLAARNLRTKAASSGSVPDDIKAYFANFDRLAVSNRKAELETVVVPGEASRFVSGISGQTTEWKTTPVYVDRLDANTALVETQLNVRLLNRENETGIAVFRLVRSGGNWKLYSVDIFEVR
jgi:tetratricopeptide (TPR) repeat protein